MTLPSDQAHGTCAGVESREARYRAMRAALRISLGLWPSEVRTTRAKFELSWKPHSSETSVTSRSVF